MKTVRCARFTFAQESLIEGERAKVEKDGKDKLCTTKSIFVSVLKGATRMMRVQPHDSSSMSLFMAQFCLNCCLFDVEYIYQQISKGVQRLGNTHLESGEYVGYSAYDIRAEERRGKK